MKSQYLLLLPVVLFSLLSCKPDSLPPTEGFIQKWYAGKAEISNYTLEQARYGEIRNGVAVLIFVTEDFSSEKLVKLDEPDNANNKTRVLKMNMTKNFVTGIYPYSMMLSVFSPVSANGEEKALKVNSSSQEWCGQTFSQLQLKSNEYSYQLHSYFEKEGEQDKNLDAILLEDEIWNRIRFDPNSLPIGKTKIIPGLLWQRLSHMPLQVENCNLSSSSVNMSTQNDTTSKVYIIEYPAYNRTLKIYYNDLFPYEILGWEETYPDGFGNNKKMLTTKAVRKKTVWLDYWKYNNTADSSYRDTLQLMHYE